MMEPRQGLVVFVVLILTSVAAPGLSQDGPQPVEPPDTAQGRCVEAYVAAFNSGDDDAMRRFFTEYLRNAGLQRDAHYCQPGGGRGIEVCARRLH